MITQLLLVLALGCFSEACKRSASNSGQEQPDGGMLKKAKVAVAGSTAIPRLEHDPQTVPARMLTRGLLRRNLAENRLAPQFTLGDILGIVICKVAEDFPLRPKSDPIGHLASVSRQWHAFFRSKLFWETIIKTPNAALYAFLTKVPFSFGTNRAIFMSAKGLLFEEERLDLIGKVDDPVVMIALGELSYGQPAYSVLASLYQQLRRTVPGEFVPKGNWKKLGTFSRKLRHLFVQSYEQPPEEYILMKMTSTDLMRLFYLYDLKNPFTLTWIYPFIAQQACQLYHRHPEFRPKLAARMQELSRVTLPQSHTSLVFECMCRVMLIAALAKDSDFLRMLSLDYAVLEGLYFAEGSIHEDFKEYHRMVQGSQTKISLRMIAQYQTLLIKILERGTHGFSVASIKETLGEATLQVNLDPGVFVKIQDYINSD